MFVPKYTRSADLKSRAIRPDADSEKCSECWCGNGWYFARNWSLANLQCLLNFTEIQWMRSFVTAVSVSHFMVR
jgi:hypothetical protein